MTRKVFLNGTLAFVAMKPWRLFAADGMSEPITLNVPPQDAAHTRAYDYEVAAEVEECDIRRIACTKRVYSPAYFLAPEREPKTVSCVFSLNELNTRKGSCFAPTVRFIVRAAETFGKKSEAIASASSKILT